jgi:hypothetical protein
VSELELNIDLYLRECFWHGLSTGDTKWRRKERR